MSESIYRATFEHMAEPLLLLDGDGRVMAANAAAGRLFGREPAALRTMDLQQLLVSPDDAALLSPAACVLPFRRADGSLLRAEARRLPVLIPGRPAHATIALRELPAQASLLADADTARLDAVRQQALLALSRVVELRDPHTAGHENRVGIIARELAAELDWQEQRCRHLQMAGLVHDVGKVAVPAELLAKPAALTPLEYEVVQHHVRAGYEILKDFDFPLPLAEIVLQHHERHDGSGYPRGLQAEQILPEARLIAVADALDAMLSHQPYRSARDLDAALAELQAQRGRMFDPQVVDAALRRTRASESWLPPMP